jgi:gliding motility-associated-like protein
VGDAVWEERAARAHQQATQWRQVKPCTLIFSYIFNYRLVNLKLYFYRQFKYMPYLKLSFASITSCFNKLLLFALLIIISANAFAQAPNISYHTPNVYAFATPITPLAPVNTGGAVPATIYGQVSTFAGSGSIGSANGTGTAASFNSIYGLTLDATGNIYVADCLNQLIRKVLSTAVVSTLAGSGSTGRLDGTSTAASFNNPGGVTTDAAGNVYVGDQTNNLIRKITPAGVVTTFAGTGVSGSNNGNVGVATFNSPAGLVFDASGNLYIADRLNNMIRKITPAGIVSTFAGSGAAGNSNGTGSSATFNGGSGVAVDQSGNIYVADQYNHMIRKITPAGVVTTLAGSGAQGSANGAAATASFYKPFGLTVDYPGNVYVADQFNHLIRKITPAGVVSTIAGTGSIGTADGIGTAASFGYPDGIALDGLGNGYISESLSQKIRKIVLTGYTIDKALPAGLTFDPTTGIISGTPTVLWPATIYTVIAYNTSGSSSTPVSIEVDAAGVTFNPLPAKTICDADFDPGATSPFAITYTSSNTAVATIVAGKVHIVGAGTTLITAAISTGSTKQTLTVTAPATPVVTIAPDYSSICTGMTVTYTAKVTSGGNNPVYQWKLNGTNVGTSSVTYVTTTITPTDVVQCVVTNNDTCPVSGTSNSWTGVIVTPYTTPGISIASSANGAVCPGTGITFTAAITNGGTSPQYQWQVNGVNAGTNSATFTSSSLANGDAVTCMLTNQGGACLTTLFATSNTINAAIILPPNPAPTVTIAASANGVITGTAITFTATTANTTGGVLSYQWKVNGNNMASTAASFTSSTLKNGDVVTCEITVVFACSITVSSQQLVANILGTPPLVIPNTFTPNGDSVNDTWNITNLAYYPNATVFVYNRYGILLYQSKGYTVQWDGTYAGKPVPVGTYEYMIDIGDGSKLSGSIAVVR